MRRFFEYPGLKDVYIAKTGEKITRRALVERIYKLATRWDAAHFETGREGIAGVTIRLHANLPPLHVLLRREGVNGPLRDMRVAMDRGVELEQMLERITKSGAKSTAQLMAPHNDAVAHRQFQHLWRMRKDSFTQVHKELKKSPDFAFLTGAKFLQALHELANAAEAARTRVKDVYEAAVTVQLPNGQPIKVNLLRRLDAKGMLADVHLVPENKNDKEDLLNRMEKGAGQSATRADPHRKPDFSTTFRERRKRIWKAISADFHAEYAAYCQLPKNRKKSGTVFVKHLDELCDKEPGERILHADKTITRHIVQPGGSDEPLAVLRYGDDRGLGALRKVRNDRSDEQESLQAVLQDIGKLAGPAPASARAAASGGVPRPATKETTHKRELQDASLLKRALELMLDNKKRGVNPFEGVAEASGVPVRILTSWLSAEGGLKGSVLELRRVHGYSRVREDLAELFRRLGQHASADKLPPPMSTGLVVQALQALHANPAASHEGLAALLNTATRVIKQRIDVDTGELLMSNTQLRSLPDYERRREDLRACLVALKQGGRADRLPAPETQAETFLRDVHEQFYSIAAALDVMRRDNRLSSREAAAKADEAPDMPALLDLLARPGGILRSRDEIAARLPGFDPRLAQQLNVLLQHLETRPVSEMATVMRPKRGMFSATAIFVVNRGEGDPSAGVSTRLSKIYAHSPDLVTRPRPYTNEPVKQALRWLSTTLKQQFPKAVDVQCYWDAETRRVWVSSNVTAVNESIQRFLGAGKLMEVLRDPPGDPRVSRTARHGSRLRCALVDGKTQDIPAEARDLLEAMTELTRYHVPMQSFYDDGARVDLHAERRIQAALREEGKRLNPRFLGGIRRPCTVCAKELGLPDTAHRGPAWLSRAAEAFVDTHAVVNENLRKGIGSYATQMPNGKPTLDYDTDSDSETEAATRPHAKRPMVDDAGSSHAAVQRKRSARERRSDTAALSMDAASADALFAREGRAAKRQAAQASALPNRPPAQQSTEGGLAPSLPVKPLAFVPDALVQPNPAAKQLQTPAPTAPSQPIDRPDNSLSFLTRHLEPSLWNPRAGSPAWRPAADSQPPTPDDDVVVRSP